MEKKFIKNVLDVEVNGFTGSVRYVIREMNDVIDDDNVATIEQKIVEDVTMTRQQIKNEGGHQEIINQLKECYSPLEV